MLSLRIYHVLLVAMDSVSLVLLYARHTTGTCSYIGEICCGGLLYFLDLNQSSVHQCRKVANWFANHIGSLVLSAVVYRLPVSIKG